MTFSQLSQLSTTESVAHLEAAKFLDIGSEELDMMMSDLDLSEMMMDAKFEPSPDVPVTIQLIILKLGVASRCNHYHGPYLFL